MGCQHIQWNVYLMFEQPCKKTNISTPMISALWRVDQIWSYGQNFCGFLNFTNTRQLSGAVHTFSWRQRSSRNFDLRKSSVWSFRFDQLLTKLLQLAYILVLVSGHNLFWRTRCGYSAIENDTAACVISLHLSLSLSLLSSLDVRALLQTRRV